MKKSLLILPVLGLVTSLMTSCGGDSTPKLMIWATESEHQVINKVLGDYNAAQEKAEDKIEYELKAVSEADAGTEVGKDATTEGAPSLFLCADDHIYNLQEKNVIMEITGDLKTQVTSKSQAVAVTGASFGDKLFGFPVTSDNGYFLWHNPAALTAEQAGSLEGLLAAAKAAGKTVGMEVANGWDSNSFLMSPQACGTDSLKWSVNAEGKVSYTTNWDGEVGVKVATYIGSLLKEYTDNGTLLAATNADIEAGFQNGTMIAAVTGTWEEQKLVEYCPDVVASKLPEYHIDGQAYQMASFTGSKIYCVNKTKSVDEQKLAAKVAGILTTKEAQLIRYETRTTSPCNVDALADSRYADNVTRGLKALAEQNAFACVQSQTAEGRYWDVGKAIGQAYIDGKLGEGETWQTFLKARCDALRVAQ
ncbi:MAG: extracellular solute-binding protein [Bacilli bacterium]|nr:extracellular solute-binding protein [Bacilli bacterium]